MNLRTRLAALSLAAGTLIGCSNQRSKSFDHSSLNAVFALGLDSLAAALDSVAERSVNGARPELRRAFIDARRTFKLHELLIASESPHTMGVLNGPLPENDDDPNQPLGGAAGFQRLEDRLYADGELSASDRSSIRDDATHMSKQVTALRTLAPESALTETHMLDAIREELARISVLGLAGFDSNRPDATIAEAHNALLGMSRYIGLAQRESALHEEWSALDSAVLHAAQVVNHQDRLAFITTQLSEIGKRLAVLRERSGAVNDSLRLVWRSRASTVFEPNAFDASAYAPAFAMHPTPDVIALGERLFNDKRLSGPQTVSCASCHIPALAFTDGMARHGSIDGSSVIGRNTPTLLNVALQPSFFADARVNTLEDQIRVVLSSKVEMASSPELAAQRIITDSGYRAAFTHAVPNGLTEASLRNVLATYLRTLVRLDSRFDAAIHGDTTVLTSSERNGFNVFMGKARCGTCHLAPLFNGVMPPGYVISEPEIIGVPSRADTSHATLDTDPGRSRVNKNKRHRGAFSVPTLRNIARTAPYMHNGVYATLEQVIDFYNRGGGWGVGASVPEQTLPKRPLHLTTVEQRDLVAFLGTLTDRAR